MYLLLYDTVVVCRRRRRRAPPSPPGRGCSVCALHIYRCIIIYFSKKTLFQQ